MNEKPLTAAIVFFLALLFAYTSTDKLIDMAVFRGQMLNQPLPEWLSLSLAWTLPFVEISTGFLLIIKRTRRIGLYISFLLMLSFTLYTGVGWSGLLERTPCSCGGILQWFSWQEHLFLNLAITILTLIALIEQKLNPMKRRL